MSEKNGSVIEKFSGSGSYSVSAKKPRKQKSIYGDQLLCLITLLGMSVWKSGWRAFVIALLCVITCMLSDALFCRMSKKTYNPKDLSTLAAGLCIALMMPSSVSYGIVVGGGLLAMGLKHIFGGKDNYIFNPTAAAMAFLIICFPQEMLLYPNTGVQPPIFGTIGSEQLVSGIESYLLKLGTAPSVPFQDILIGNYVGPLGTTHFLVLAVCGICLLARRSLSLLVTLSGLGSYCALTALFPVYNSIGDTLILELIGGYLLFGFVFLAGDPQTTPKTPAGKIAYGLTIGIVGCLFRHFGKVEGSFLFVLLIANALSLHLDTVCAAAGVQLKRMFSYLFRNMGRYERLRETAKEGGGKRLSDTMEIIVPPTNYNMPPIDGKVTKIKRKKTNLFERYAQTMEIKRKKQRAKARSNEREGR